MTDGGRCVGFPFGSNLGSTANFLAVMVVSVRALAYFCEKGFAGSVLENEYTSSSGQAHSLPGWSRITSRVVATIPVHGACRE